MVDTRVCNDEKAALAEEISLAENLIREAMSPADECRGYRAALDKGETEEDVARRLGGYRSSRTGGAFRLADLAEPIFNALAEGKITVDVAKAYGSSSDRDVQLAAWNNFKDHWQGDQPHTIRRYVTDSAVEATSAVARLVGEADYLAAGGRIERDLFAGDGEGQWLDRPIAEELARAKLEQAAAEIMQLGTLGWVRVVLAQHVPHNETEGLHDYHIRRGELSDADQARMTAIEERLQAIEEEIEDATDQDVVLRLEAENEALDAEHTEIDKRSYVIPEDERPNVGTFIVLASDGTPKVSHRYFSTAAPKREKRAPTVTEVGAGPAAIENVFPRSLEEQLAKDRRDVLALHVAQDPGLALDLTIFRLAKQFTGYAAYNDTGVMVTIGELFDPTGFTAAQPTAAQDSLEAIRSGLPCDWAALDNSFDAFLAFRELDEADKAAWLAFAVSRSLQASLATGDRKKQLPDPAWRAARDRDRRTLAAERGILLRQKSANRRFSRSLASSIRSFRAAMPVKRRRRSPLPQQKLCAGETITTPEVKERALSWIPETMEFRSAGTPSDPEAPLVDDDSAEEQPAIDDGGDAQDDDLDPGVNDIAQQEDALAEAA